jgi:hypothetical protein
MGGIEQVGQFAVGHRDAAALAADDLGEPNVRPEND